MRRSLAALAAGTLASGALLTASTATAAAAHHKGHPASEHVTAAVDDVRIAYRDTAHRAADRTIVLHGKRADRLIAIFNRLKRESPDAVHCFAMGTASTTVTFKGPHHTWSATQMICTNLTVTRDGDRKPTLIPTKAWTDALTRYLGHPPTGSGSVSPSGG
ncbi:MAG TPA: hypothetical protein VHB18_03295 [Mycobacteriales bacterium]|jgi:hypothetical protein|nr:hypothetical protein [Mycobacteriales bacterium]